MGRNTLDFLSTLEKEVLLSDGAKSTVWYAQGLNPASYAEQNISNPENRVYLRNAYDANNLSSHHPKDLIIT